MTLTHVGTGTVVHGTGGPISPAFHGGYSVVPGDLAIVTVWSGSSTAATPTSSNTDWFQVDTNSNGAGAYGNGVGPRRITWFQRELQAGDTVPTFSVTGTSPVLSGCVTIWSKTAGNKWWCAAGFAGITTAATAWSASPGNPGMRAGDAVMIAYAVADDSSATAEAITATGATFGTVSERVDSPTTNGNDQTAVLCTADVTAGAATANPTVTATIATSEGGNIGVLRVREVQRFYAEANSDPLVTVAAPDANWDSTADAVTRRLERVQRATTETFQGTLGGAAGDSALALRGVTPPLDGAQTVSGVWSGTSYARELDAADNIDKRPRKVYVLAPDGTIRGTLVAWAEPSATLEMTTALAPQQHGFDSAFSSVSASDGDRLVIEFGFSETAIGTTPQWEARIGGVGIDCQNSNNGSFGVVPWFDVPTALLFRIEEVVNRADETDTAQPITARKTAPVGQASETDTAGIITARKIVTVGQAPETDEAQIITARKTAVLGQATETDTAGIITPVQAGGGTAVNQAAETDEARPITALRMVLVNRAEETDLARLLTPLRIAPVNRAEETDTARPLTVVRAAAVGRAEETDTARLISSRKAALIGMATEVDLAQEVVRPGVINRADETDAARQITAAKVEQLGQALETDLARQLTALHVLALGQALETDDARALAAAKLATVNRATETDTAQPITGLLGAIVVHTATETDLALAIVVSGGVGPTGRPCAVIRPILPLGLGRPLVVDLADIRSLKSCATVRPV